MSDETPPDVMPREVWLDKTLKAASLTDRGDIADKYHHHTELERRDEALRGALVSLYEAGLDDFDYGPEEEDRRKKAVAQITAIIGATDD